MRSLLILLLTLSLLVPTAMQPVKALLLGGIFALALPALARGSMRLPWTPWLLLAMAYAAYGVLMSLFGEIRGNPGALSVMSVMVAYPLIMTMLIDIAKPGDARRLDVWLLRISAAIAVVDIAFVAWTILDPANPLAALMENFYGEWAVVDSSSESTLFTLPNIASIIFLLPYALIRSALEPHGKPKWLWLMGVFMLAFPMLLSGRRALYLGSALGLAAGLIAAAGLRGYQRAGPTLSLRVLQTMLPLVLVGASAFVVGINIGLISWDLVVAGVEGLFDFQGEQSNVERRLQFDALLEGIAQAPLFGQGAGAVASYIRSDEMPWAYELLYIAFIFHYGLVGFMVYASGIGALLLVFLNRCVRNDQSNVMAAWFGALVAFLFASATNPYLLKFDYMWVVFIPLAWVFSARPRLSTRHPSALGNAAMKQSAA